MVEAPIKEATEEILSIPGKLKLIREWNGISQAQIAAELHVTQPMVSRWEGGRMLPRDPLHVAIILKWAEQVEKKGVRYAKISFSASTLLVVLVYMLCLSAVV